MQTSFTDVCETIAVVTRRLVGMRSNLQIRWSVHAPCEWIGRSFQDVMSSSIDHSAVELCLHDNSLSDEDFRYWTDVVGQIADSGILVRPRLLLASGVDIRWQERITQWYTISRGNGLDLRLSDSVRDGQLCIQITKALTEVYGSKALDIVRCEPFRGIANVLFWGSTTDQRCHSKRCLTIADRRIWQCARCVRGCSQLMPYCDCVWGPFCAAIHPICQRSVTDKIGAISAICRLASAIIPLILMDVLTTAMYQGQLANRETHDRVRIAARDGKPVMWKDSVITDHRSRRGENADGTRKHIDVAQLSGIDAAGASVNAATNP